MQFFRVLSSRIFCFFFFHAQQISDGARRKKKYIRVIPETRSCWPAWNPRTCLAHILNWPGPCFRGIWHFPCSPPSSPEKGGNFDSRLFLHKHYRNLEIYIYIYVCQWKKVSREAYGYFFHFKRHFWIVRSRIIIQDWNIFETINYFDINISVIYLVYIQLRL